jgi:hypothetical protein
MGRFDLQLDFEPKSAEPEWGGFDLQLDFQKKSAEAEWGRLDLQLDYHGAVPKQNGRALICNSISNRRVRK